MVLKRGSNGAAHPGQNGRIPTVLDLAALDDLGPQARAALVNAPLPILAYPVLKQVMDRNELIEQENIERAERGEKQKPYLDPNDARLDAFLADNILQYNVELLMKDRGREFATAGVVPLKARYNPKTERDQRRLRRVRW